MGACPGTQSSKSSNSCKQPAQHPKKNLKRPPAGQWLGGLVLAKAHKAAIVAKQPAQHSKNLKRPPARQSGNGWGQGRCLPRHTKHGSSNILAKQLHGTLAMPICPPKTAPGRAMARGPVLAPAHNAKAKRAASQFGGHHGSGGACGKCKNLVGKSFGAQPSG